MAKKIFGRLPLLAVVVGLVLSSTGCGTLFDILKGNSYQKTATSQMLLEGANDIILTKEDGINPDAFKIIFVRKFSLTDYKLNLTFASSGNMSFTYKGKKYRILTVKGTPTADERGMAKILSVAECVELIPKEKKEEKK